MEHVTSADGTRIAFTRSGRGTPLLLVHGAAGAGSRWAGISPALESAFTVHAMDRRGRGSSGDGERYSLAREADDVVAVLDAIGGDAIVLGHSFGALVTLEAVRQRPGIRGVILYEPPIRTAEPLFPTSLISDLEAVLATEGPESLVEQFMI